MFALQRADEFEHVLIRHYIRRRGRAFAEQVIHHGPLKRLALAGQIGNAIGRVGDDLGGLRAAKALAIDGLLDERIKRGGHEQIKVGDLGQLPQRFWRLKRHIAQDAANTGVGVFTPTARREKPAHNVIQRVRLRQKRGVHAQLFGQLIRQPIVEKTRPGVGFNLKQLGPNDRHHALFFDEIKQVVPSVIIETGRRKL